MITFDELYETWHDPRVDDCLNRWVALDGEQLSKLSRGLEVRLLVGAHDSCDNLWEFLQPSHDGWVHLLRIF